MRMKFMNPVTDDERTEIMGLIQNILNRDEEGVDAGTLHEVVDWLNVLITPIVYTENGG